MGQPSTLSLVALAAVWFAAVAYGEGPAEGWRADFDDGTLGGAGEPQYFNRSEGPTRTDPDRASWKIEDGVVTIAGEFGPGSRGGAGDFVPLGWDKLEVSLVDYPVLEMRLRVSGKAGGRLPSELLLVQCTYEYADGSRRTPYYYPKIDLDRPGEWVTLTRRIAGDTSAPGGCGRPSHGRPSADGGL